MNHRYFHWVLIMAVIVAVVFGTPFSIHAQNDWRVRARLDVDRPGIVEAVLPPELHAQTGGQSLDLELKGPDGQSRSFELYWREPVGAAKIELKTEKLEFIETRGFVWEGRVPETFITRKIKIEIADPNFVGSVDVEVRDPDGWKHIKKKEALFKTRGQKRAELNIQEGIYESFRLRFTTFDPKYEKKFAPVSRVTLYGEKPGKDYVTQWITPVYKYFETEKETEIRTILPGSGLFIESLRFTTQAQFQGTWKMGREIIKQGKQTFAPLFQGSVQHVSKEKQAFTLDIKRTWPGRNLVLKLDHRQRYIGKVTALKVNVRRLRLVFSADTPGIYTAQTGTGRKADIFRVPGDTTRQIEHFIKFTPPEINQNRRPETLVEKYGIKGGPFNDAGFTWKAMIPLTRPGLYRLVLNRQASHEKNRTGIRLVKDGTQIPFFLGAHEIREIDLTVDADSKYDSKKNETTLTIGMPYTSSHWIYLRLQSSGIFRRRIICETRKPGKMGWEQWKTVNWENRRKKTSRLTIRLDGFPGGQNEIRFTISHGDNQPIEINRISAFYSAPSVLFLAGISGEYFLYGGHPDTSPPNYDLSLVQPYLLDELPQTARMASIEAFRSATWKSHLGNIFKNQAWGLYIVLSLVTIVLLLLIVKLFPKATKPE